MCGIAGVYQKIGKRDPLKEGVMRMNERQFSRGPDDGGVVVAGEAVLGNRRLAFQDLSKKGHQPMQWQKREGRGRAARGSGASLTVTFNGEIYNFLELRHALEKHGVRFKTKSDTEVVLALYAMHGEASFSMLRGMFAFALWDRPRGRFFLVRDRYGIKPLYYYADARTLVCASTISALKASGLIPVKENPRALIGFLLFGSVPFPWTTLEHVTAVPPGHYLVKEGGAAARMVKYYDSLAPFRKKNQDDMDEASRRVRTLLEESVRLHLISDAPLGVFLSGGLDSSVIAALAASGRQAPLTTLSVRFGDEAFSEERYQRGMAERIGSDHREVMVTADDLARSHEAIFAAMDQPSVDGVNTFFIAEAAKKAGIKAVLSGLGSDEIFYGYPFMRRAAFFRRIHALPRVMRAPFALFCFAGDRAQKLAHLRRDGALQWYMSMRGLFAPRDAAELLGTTEEEVRRFLDDLARISLASDAAFFDEMHAADALSYFELKWYLHNQLLKDTDCMSMHHSVEVRVPFLDHRLVEYVSSVQSDLKFDRAVNKPLLVRAVEDAVPQEILARRKMGFTFPLAHWLKAIPQDTPREPRLAREPKKAVEARFRAGRMHWSRYWATVVADTFA